MKLILMRHGQATAYCDDDAGRNLTDFGQFQAHQSASQIMSDHQPDLIIASPFNRADQTAKILWHLAQRSGVDLDFITLSSITPDDDPALAVSDIEHVIRHKFGQDIDDKCVVVVCHMPIVSRISAILEGLPESFFQLAEYRLLDMAVVAEGLGTCLSSFIPDQPE